MIDTVLAIGGAIVLAGNVGAVIFKIIKPSLDIRKRVDELERRDQLDFERLQKLEENLQELQELTKANCKMQLVMIDHMIDGNNVEKMKKTRDDIIEMIVAE